MCEQNYHQFNNWDLVHKALLKDSYLVNGSMQLFYFEGIVKQLPTLIFFSNAGLQVVEHVPEFQHRAH